eukprot:366292_1
MNCIWIMFLISYFCILTIPVTSLQLDKDITTITFIGTGSGTPDIAYVLSTNIVDSIIGNYTLNHIEPHSNYVIGYRSTLLISSNHSHYNGYLKSDKQGYAILKQLLQFIPLKENIITHIHQRNEQMLTKYTNSNTKYLSDLQNKFQTNCTLPIVGPDSWKEIQYNPTYDDCGFFTGTHQSENNCYAYATDIVTDTFPQPGRGSGQKWQYNTCEDMIAAAERDGLKWIGNTLIDYSYGPLNGHYVALYIWPNTNFHWARMDYNGTYNNSDVKVVNQILRRWSHKPGGTEIQTVDNNGNCIGNIAPCVLPSQADLSPWSVFCGYLMGIPSDLTIN